MKKKMKKQLKGKLNKANDSLKKGKVQKRSNKTRKIKMGEKLLTESKPEDQEMGNLPSYMVIDTETTDSPSSNNKNINYLKKKRKHLKGSVNQEERKLTEFLFEEASNDLNPSNRLSSKFDCEDSFNIEEKTFPNVKMVEFDKESDSEVSQKKRRQAAWVDEDDENTKVKDVVASYSKAKGSRGPRETSDVRYKDTLTDKFTEVFGAAPEWSKLDRSHEEEEDLTKTSVYLASKGSLKGLPKGRLDFKRLKDLNGESYKEGAIVKAVDFCPDLGVALVAGCTKVMGAASLFQFDGVKNHLIKSTVFPSFPIKCAKFLPGKQQFVVGSNAHWRFYVYDIKESKKIDVFRPNQTGTGTMKNFEVTPDGKFIASINSGGWVNFFDTTSLSLVEKVRVPCEVAAIAFNSEANLMFMHGDSGHVFVYDLLEWRCRHRFYDDGCVKGTSIAISPDDRLLACGSSSGIVNVYEVSTVLSSATPKPLKAIMKLTTLVDFLDFHPSSEILAVASSFKDNAIRLVHVQSLQLFENFPGPFEFQRVQGVKFSPNGKFLVVANNKRAATLCRLLHY